MLETKGERPLMFPPIFSWSGPYGPVDCDRLSNPSNPAQRDIPEKGCLFVMKIKQNKNAIRILAKLSIDFLCIIPYTYYE